VRFLLDENADYGLVGFLAARGHDVLAVGHDHPPSLSDEEVLSIALAEDRIVITNDTDFGELVFQRGQPHVGVILFRLRDESLATYERALQLVLDRHSDDLSEFVVVTERSVRVRRSTPDPD
jgi:predicted nuclease of predicted toxin-antitoxin system